MQQKGGNRSDGGYYSGLLDSWASVNDQALETWAAAVRHWMPGSPVGTQSARSTGAPDGTVGGPDPGTAWSAFLDELSQLWSDWLSIFDVSRTAASHPVQTAPIIGDPPNTGDPPNSTHVTVPAQPGPISLTLTGPLQSRTKTIDIRAVSVTPSSVPAGAATTVVVKVDPTKIPAGIDDVYGGFIEPDNAVQPIYWRFSIHVQS
jgi:hypothetical protein